MWLLPFVCIGLHALPNSLVALSPELREIVDYANRSNLPMPPRDAPLVLAHAQVWEGTEDGSGDAVPFYIPAFLIEKGKGYIIVLQGFKTTKVYSNDNEAAWRPYSIKALKPTSGKYGVDVESQSCMAVVAQLAKRGDLIAAMTLYTLCRRANASNFESYKWFKRPSITIATMLFDHLIETIKYGIDRWKQIHVQMKLILNDFPELNDGKRGMVFRDLTLAMNDNPPKKGSVESLLLIWSERSSGRFSSDLFVTDDDPRIDSAARSIVLRGFDAVPELIKLLSDRRMTSLIDSNGDNCRLGDLAEKLLTEIAAKDSMISLEQKQATSIWREWWKSTSGVREETYYLRRLFQRANREITGTSGSAAWILAFKYPKHCESICEDFIRSAKQDVSPYYLASAVAAGRAPEAEKIKLLLRLCKHGSLEQRLDATFSLLMFNQKAGNQVLLSLLRGPITNQGTGIWARKVPLFACLVHLSNSKRVWVEYKRITTAVPANLRIEILARMGACSETHNSRFMIEFLESFLNDTAVRRIEDIHQQYRGRCVASEFPAISVRNFVAMELCDILKIDSQPMRSWNENQWSMLRNDVRRKIAEKVHYGK